MQQPAYWAVPSGSNPAGTVTVPYAGAAGTQLQNQGQVCRNYNTYVRVKFCNCGLISEL